MALLGLCLPRKTSVGSLEGVWQQDVASPCLLQTRSAAGDAWIALPALSTDCSDCWCQRGPRGQASVAPSL